jgi:hypothetical protein
MSTAIDNCTAFDVNSRLALPFYNDWKREPIALTICLGNTVTVLLVCLLVVVTHGVISWHFARTCLKLHQHNLRQASFGRLSRSTILVHGKAVALAVHSLVLSGSLELHTAAVFSACYAVMLLPC